MRWHIFIIRPWSYLDRAVRGMFAAIRWTATESPCWRWSSFAAAGSGAWVAAEVRLRWPIRGNLAESCRAGRRIRRKRTGRSAAPGSWAVITNCPADYWRSPSSALQMTRKQTNRHTKSWSAFRQQMAGKFPAGKRGSCVRRMGRIARSKPAGGGGGDGEKKRREAWKNIFVEISQFTQKAVPNVQELKAIHHDPKREKERGGRSRHHHQCQKVGLPSPGQLCRKRRPTHRCPAADNHKMSWNIRPKKEQNKDNSKKAKRKQSNESWKAGRKKQLDPAPSVSAACLIEITTNRLLITTDNGSAHLILG